MKHNIGKIIEQVGFLLIVFVAGCWASIWLRDVPWLLAGLFILGCVLSFIGNRLPPQAPPNKALQPTAGAGSVPDESRL